MSFSFAERYKKLNKAQKQAVDTIEGPLLVVAGPGSGKTEILSLRVAQILKETQALPSNILCLTFTDSAAVNMRDRLSKLIGQEAYRVAIHTFHSFAIECIQKYPEFFYKGAVFAPADPISQIAILEEIFGNLSHDNPLRSSHPDQGFVYLSDVSRIIGHLKKAGVNPDELDELLKENEIDMAHVSELLGPLMSKTVSAKVVGEIAAAQKQLAEKASFKNAHADIHAKTGFPSLLHAVAISLEEALIRASDLGKNEPVSKWKEKWFKKDDSGTKVFRDVLSLEKIKVVSGIYRQYRETMHARSMFDFDDMILDLIAAIESHPRLRHDLQEQFQYILVDEFQDTNNAQMRIIKLVADAPVHEGKPNIMVVGDDDQAVYKFQGAELSNILNFRTSFSDVGVVNMTSNYRSTQDILDVATHIIRKGEHRLENLIPQLEKTLVASNPEIKRGSIVHKVFDTSLHELHYVSRRIRSLLESGVSANDIAVISSKHRQLESLVPYMKGAGVPIKYEREQNVFLEPHIAQLILMGRFVNSIARHGSSEADEHLPRILAFPFWGLPRMSIWNISKTAYAERKTWLEAMVGSEDAQVRRIAEFLIDLGERAPDEPLESLLDQMIGAHVQLVQENEDEEVEGEEAETFRGSESAAAGKASGAVEKLAVDGDYGSPFKSYYFNKERFDHARAEYLSFLSSLRVFVKALREYKGKASAVETLKLQDMIDFVDIHQKNGVALNDQSPFANSTNAVHLLSAHKSKGLEFDTVFVLSCTDDVWAGRGGSRKITLPANMPIEPAGESDDDKLRLFYVALTRAKKNLYITSYKVKDDGKEALMLRFLTSDSELHEEVLKKLYAPEQGDEEMFKETYTPETHELLTASWILYHTPPFFGEERALLKSVLENYQLSVTHLNNYLNVAKGGPQLFLEQNLLRFPQAKSPSGSFGTAVHRTLEKAGVHVRAEGKLPGKDEFLAWFKAHLAHERLSRADMRLFEGRGISALSAFYDQKMDGLQATDLLEVNFKNQGVILAMPDSVSNPSSAGPDFEIHPAHLAGKIDRIVKVSGGEYEVRDYKTGKPKSEWEGKDEYEKIKLHEYGRQLMFYKILVEHSRDYSDFKVSRGVLDFVEPHKNGSVVELRLDIDPELHERTKRLAAVVFGKIMNLDFPDVAGKYEPTLKGIRQFEDDLLEGKI